MNERRQRKGRRTEDTYKEQYQTLINSIDAGFCIAEIIIDKNKNPVDLKFIETNPVFEKISTRKLAGKRAKKHFPGFDARWLKKFYDISNTGKPLRFTSFIEETKHWYDIYVAKVGRKGNRKIALLLNDITEQKSMEEMLKESLRSRDEFISIATHELKTPVTSLKVLAEVSRMLYEREGDIRTAEIFKEMDGQFDTLTNLINDLLDATRIKEGKLLFRKDYFDFHKLLLATIKEVQYTSKKHSIIYENDEFREHLCYADRYRIAQVITNLLTNALKYSPKAKRVIVRLTKEKDGLIFSVQDFGDGIEESKQKAIFERFFQTETASRRSKPGLGLGLYISREIIDRHDGQIWVESKGGKGSTFFFKLPLKKSKT